MESKKINQLATELAPDLSDITIIGDPNTGISKKITLSQMASLFTGTVEEYANFAAFPLVGVADTIYIAKDTNVIYRWDSTAYVVLSPNIIASLVFNDANGFDGNISLVGSVATLTITTALTTGSVPFIGASGALSQDNANLFFDDTNNRLGINTNAPTTALDVFGSGIIGRINGTSTNNAFLGFASAGTNKWSIGNVQSDHRFRIFSEANSSELISVLQTGEFGIGISNPTTKFHIDGGASALIANLDANVSVAKSISFRSDNSNRINLEVSGTESGSNAGADIFLRTYTDAGALIETPFSIVRSTGVTTIKSLTLTNVLSVANGGTGSATQNFVDLTTAQTIAGAKSFTAKITISGITGNYFQFNRVSTSDQYQTWYESNGTTRRGYFGYGESGNNNFYLLNEQSGNLYIGTNNLTNLTLSSTGAALFSNTITAAAATFTAVVTPLIVKGTNASTMYTEYYYNTSTLVGSIGNGSGLLTGANASDFITRSEAAYVIATGGNNRRLTVTSTGNVGIGITEPVSKLHIAGQSGTTGLPALLLYGESPASGQRYGFNVSSDQLDISALGASARIGFYTGGAANSITERARFTSTGYFKATSTGSYNDTNAANHEFVNGTASANSFFVGNTNTSYSGATLVRINGSRTTTNATYNLIGATNGNSTGEFLVRDSGNCQNTNNSYTGTSDIKLKQDIIDANSQWEDIKQMRIRKFRFKKQVEQDENAPYLLGVIAQELELISPNLVDETLDFDGTGEEVTSTTKSVKYSIIYMKAVKALQEAMEKIEILEEEVKLLKAK